MVRKHRARTTPVFNSEGQLIDTIVNDEKKIFIKSQINEVYPEQVLIYRDLSGDADNRTSRYAI